MPRKSKKGDFSPHISATQAPPCSAEGCLQAGEYKAPKSREQLGEYIWLCLDHIRERNKKWDYFEGMESPEIEAFMQDAVTGHRPTWSRDGRIKHHLGERYFTLQDALYEFMHGNKPMPAQPRIPAKTRKALTVMEITYPYTLEQLKTSYRTLVKKYHPDLNKGDKKLEENFKNLTAAYKYLSEQLKP